MTSRLPANGLCHRCQITITDVRTVLLTGPCTNDPYFSEARKLRSAAFIEVHTDAGIVGLGAIVLMGIEAAL